MSADITRRHVVIGAVASATALAVAASGASARDPVVHDVRIKSFAFVPDNLQVRVGDIIRWTNEDLAPHTATADALGWDTGSLDRGQSGEVVVNADMETTYFCIFHPHMRGSLKVLPA